MDILMPEMDGIEATEKTEFLIEGRTKQIIKNDCI